MAARAERFKKHPPGSHMAPLSSEHFLSEQQGPPLSLTHCNRLSLPLGQLLTTFLCNFSTTCQLSTSQLNLCVLDGIAFETKTRLICTWVVRKDFIRNIETGAGMRIKFRWGKEKGPNWRIANLRSNYYTHMERMERSGKSMLRGRIRKSNTCHIVEGF